MEKSHPAWKERSIGDTAVDGLTAGLLAGLAMLLLLVLTGLISGTLPAVTLGYFDPARGGSWLTGLLAHLAVSAIYGVFFALLIHALSRSRPSFRRYSWLLGLVYGLTLQLLATGLIFKAVEAPLEHVDGWQLALAHLLYGLVLGYWLGKSR